MPQHKVNGVGNLVDIHCHLLPGVDDGCQDVDESLDLATRMAEAGFGDVICTPHIQPPMPHNNPRQIAKNVAKLQEALDRADVPLHLHAGGENRCGKENVSAPKRELNLAAGGDSRGGSLGRQFFLFDNWGTDWPHVLKPMVERLRADGITPILAHPERTPWVWDDPLGVADRLASLGVLLQLNAYVLTGPRNGPPVHVGSQMVQTAETLLDAGRYAFAATDSHRPNAWPVRLDGIRALRDRVDEPTFLRLFRDHPRQLLPDLPST